MLQAAGAAYEASSSSLQRRRFPSYCSTSPRNDSSHAFLIYWCRASVSLSPKFHILSPVGPVSVVSRLGTSEWGCPLEDTDLLRSSCSSFSRLKKSNTTLAK